MFPLVSEDLPGCIPLAETCQGREKNVTEELDYGMDI